MQLVLILIYTLALCALRVVSRVYNAYRYDLQFMSLHSEIRCDVGDTMDFFIIYLKKSFFICDANLTESFREVFKILRMFGFFDKS